MDDETLIDLYHRTSPEAAEAVLRQRSMLSKENTGEAYFSTRPDGPAVLGYGEAVIHIRIPARLARLDDEFPDGEEHYRVAVSDLTPDRFVTG